MKIIITLILFLILGCSSDSEVIPPIMPYTYSNNEANLVDLINIYRNNQGFSTLEINQHIGYLCFTHNQHMIDTGVLGHQNFESRTNNLKLTMQATYVSELVAKNYSTNQSVLNAFLNVPSCKEILDGDKDKIGVSITEAGDKKYYTLIFIK
jgi:uncharacterized protein YkwD